VIFKYLFVFYISVSIIFPNEALGQIFRDQQSFEIFDDTKRIIYSIDIKNKQVKEILFSQGIIRKSSHALALEQIEFKELPAAFSVNSFRRSDHVYWVTIQGTGQVYEFDTETYRLKRLDHTYFRGYNFAAVQFIHNDTLFSFGGMGFWHSHSIGTYFDSIKNEWEMFPYSSKPPIRFSSRLGGYMHSMRTVFVAQMPEIYENQESNPSYVYSYEFDKNKWTKLGKINKLPIAFWKNNRLITTWIEPFFISEEMEDKLIDPVNNQILEITEKDKLFLHGSMYLFSNGEKLYNIKRNDRIDEDILVDSIAIDEIKKRAKSIGLFYTPTPFWDNWNIGYIINGIGTLLIVISMYVISKNRRRINLLEQVNVNPIPEFYHEFMDFMLKNEKNICSTNDLNDIIQVTDKPLDTQRQYRSRFIAQVNHYIHLTYGITEGIQRASSPTDKRFVYYKMSADLIKKLNRN